MIYGNSCLLLLSKTRLFNGPAVLQRIRSVS